MPQKPETKSKSIAARPLYSVRFLDPPKIVGKLDIQPGMKIAHFGCSNGYFTLPMAEKAGKDGVIYALDILEQKLDFLRGRAKFCGLSNIIFSKVNLEEKMGSRLEDESMDWVIIVNMLYQNRDKSKIIGEAKRVLKKTGRILIIEWNNSDDYIGPQNQSRISKEEIIRITRKHGLGIIKEISVSNFHFGLILAK
jgi:ubiquinone/menaquinone biosynthesis C-methylase UbiE